MRIEFYIKNIPAQVCACNNPFYGAKAIHRLSTWLAPIGRRYLSFSHKAFAIILIIIARYIGLSTQMLPSGLFIFL